VGTSLSLKSAGKSLPGYQVKFSTPEEKEKWGRMLRNLDIIFSDSYLPAPRLSEIADLEEIFAVMRIPYSPPENGFPDVNFINKNVE
jgi:hypothetical protein